MDGRLIDGACSESMYVLGTTDCLAGVENASPFVELLTLP